ncbi:hypothetical protein [Desulfovibrio gilichinskyi]|uniref:Uncharacterized protein n=1 Tax=Desulfovibrio gilichinskyi TaxID=1519643 RepID=A0A1X7CTE0_9BACT|nr:hypothetical protein [Desulfovibrio gilichinskyi]SMF02758.1 hypothetical protein SAMN06295933_1239 [Desulfovibrio gilichinskyi]
MESDCAANSAKYVIIFGGLVGFALLVFLYFQGFVFQIAPLDLNVSSQIGTLFVGTVGVLWSLGGVLLLYSTLQSQRKSVDVQSVSMQVENYVKAITSIRSNPTYAEDVKFYEHLIGVHRDDRKASSYEGVDRLADASCFTEIVYLFKAAHIRNDASKIQMDVMNFVFMSLTIAEKVVLTYVLLEREVLNSVLQGMDLDVICADRFFLKKDGVKLLRVKQERLKKLKE